MGQEHTLGAMKLTAIILVIDEHSYSYKIKTPSAWAAGVRLAGVARHVEHPSIGESRVFWGTLQHGQVDMFCKRRRAGSGEVRQAIAYKCKTA
jgi:hypothetical protein